MSSRTPIERLVPAEGGAPERRVRITDPPPAESGTSVEGHSQREGWTPVEYNRYPRRRQAPDGGESGPTHPGGSLYNRRAAAAHARRRRLLTIDLALGLALALTALALAPGLAIVALLALIGLLACMGSLLPEWRRRRGPGGG